MSALVAGLALAAALAKGPAAPSLVSHPIACAPNSDISDSGCGNTGVGNSGLNNNGAGNSGATNTGNGNSGTLNIGNGNSGTGNIGNGNSGCGNVGTANSGNGNTGTGLSGGGTVCVPAKPVTVVTAPGATPVSGATLPLTGRNSTEPIALAMGLMVSGAAAIGLANRRRHVMAATSGGELIPLSDAVGHLLTGWTKKA
jgi:LPXTG-motif cell wall-anchored protein